MARLFDDIALDFFISAGKGRATKRVFYIVTALPCLYSSSYSYWQEESMH